MDQAAAVFITAVLLPIESLLARVADVAAVPTAANISFAAGVSNVFCRCC